MKNSAINWTDHTANFWSGCVKVSAGCTHCYAETLSKRWGKDIWGPAATTPRLRGVGIWKEIKKWDREAKAEGIRRRVFVSSMSDFLEDHPMVADWRVTAMEIIEQLEWLDVLMLTKRPENAERFLGNWYDDFPPHVWMGTSVENQEAFTKRVPYLLGVPASIRFLSIEPQLEMIYFPHTGDIQWAGDLHWVICGGESGAHCRTFDWDWARQLRDDCRLSGIAFWMKQGGGHPNKREKLEEIPEDLRIRELPKGE